MAKAAPVLKSKRVIIAVKMSTSIVAYWYPPRINGIEKLKKQKTKVSIEEANIAGISMGKVTFLKRVNPLAPKLKAASS